MRGTLSSWEKKAYPDRFIPADVGNIHTEICEVDRKPVHPRGCGEHIVKGDKELFIPGSSPRMRGTFLRRVPERHVRRFIPADAGNIPPTRHSPSSGPVHPRGCGEHTPDPALTIERTGSSPRMRGTYLRHGTGFPGIRFIPADAGNIPIVVSMSTRHPVHPRGCGEHHGYERFINLITGSSPRMRGTLLITLVPLVALRFIPADAGNMTEKKQLNASLLVHPRGCGEHCSRSTAGLSMRGSSPRMRGTFYSKGE